MKIYNPIRIRKSQDIVKVLIIYIIFILFCIAILLPVYWLINSSITTKTEMFQFPPAYFTSHPVFENYYKLFTTTPFFSYFLHSLVLATVSSIVSVLFSFLAAYSFARFNFRGSNLIFMILILSSALPQMLTIIPLFEIFNKLKLVDTNYGLIILVSSILLPLTIWIMVSFIKQIPFEIEEAALVDGASRITIIMKIVLPLALPVISSMIILNFISIWNEFLYPLIFANSDHTKTLSVLLGEFIYRGSESSAGKPWDLITALTSVMVMVPTLMTIFFQRYILSGLTKGAIK